MSYRARAMTSGFALVLFAAVARGEPSASDRATARALADEAGDALDQRKYEIAVDRFERADALVHAPTLLLGLARAQVGLRKFVEAQENYQRILREGVAPGAPPSFAKALLDAQREIKAITLKLAWVTITLREPSTGIVTVDGVELPKAAIDVKRAFNPGSHVVKAIAEGYNAAAQTIEVAEGESTSVTFSLEPSADPAASALATRVPATRVPATSLAASLSTAPPNSPDTAASSGSSQQKTFGWIGLGVGAAGLIVGGVAGMVAISRHDTLESDCPNGRCPPSGQSTIDGFRTMATVSTVGFVVGGLAAAGGSVLVLTAPRRSQSGRGPDVAPYIGAASVGARMTF